MGSFAICLFLLLISTLAASKENPRVPVFAHNYKVEGILSLPYAELNEPFVAWFDKDARKSRTDFYGNLYQVYQFGPDKNSSELAHGALYKLAWVPASFDSDKIGSERLDNHKLGDKKELKTKTRRACFAIRGSDVASIGPQSVLPSLSDFTFDSLGPCPPSNIEHNNDKNCQLWKLITTVGDKKNVYKMWLDASDEKQPIPVQYYMQGYDSLLGSHYDRYDVKYYNYEPNRADKQDFVIDVQGLGCEPLAGRENMSDSDLRAQMVSQNPLHEFVDEPSRHDHIDSAHNNFMQRFNKKLDDLISHRRSWTSFMHNSRFINSHNRKATHYKLDINRFADNNLHELSYLRGRRHTVGYNGGLSFEEHALLSSNGKLSEEQQQVKYKDWRLEGAVTSVKDQAVCGSCWSFGTSGAIEGALFVKSGKLVRLSQQQMIDCSWPDGNNGCDGGEDFRAYKYIMEAGGLASEEDYGSYIGVDGKCHDNDVRKTAKLSGFYNVTSNNPDALRSAILKFGPVTVAIDASRPTFTFYSHGVYYDDKCKNTPDGLDHQVLVVGFGSLDGQDYWLVKNSWSTYWGNDGYILMAARDNNCGVMTVPTVPIVSLVQ